MTEEKEVPEPNGQEPTEKVADNQDDETEVESAIIRQVEYYFGESLFRYKYKYLVSTMLQLDE